MNCGNQSINEQTAVSVHIDPSVINLPNKVLCLKINGLVKQLKLDSANYVFTENSDREQLLSCVSVLLIMQSNQKTEQKKKSDEDKLVKLAKELEENEQKCLEDTYVDKKKDYKTITKDFDTTNEDDETTNVFDNIKRAFVLAKTNCTDQYLLFDELLTKYPFTYYKGQYKYDNDNMGAPEYMARNLNTSFLKRMEDESKYMFVNFQCVQHTTPTDNNNNVSTYQYKSFWLFNAESNYIEKIITENDDITFTKITQFAYVVNIMPGDNDFHSIYLLA